MKRIILTVLTFMTAVGLWWYTGSDILERSVGNAIMLCVCLSLAAVVYDIFGD